MFIAHGPISYLANEVIQKKKISQLKFQDQFLVSLFAFLFGILPDIDILILPIFSLPAFAHHNYFTHTPFLYIGLWLILKTSIKIAQKIFNKKTSGVLHSDLIDILLNTFLIATMVHFLADVIPGGIMMLYPFSTFKFSLLPYFLTSNRYLSNFLLPDFGIELALCTLFFIHFYKKFFQKNLFLDIVKYTALLFSTMFLVITLFFNLQTYNNGTLYGLDGKENYDMDYDGLNDTKDMDVDNDGVDNILDVDIQELTKEVKDIFDSGKLATTNTNSVTYMFGAFDSYRVFSQAYFNLHSPIEAVLRNSSLEKSYRAKLQYRQLFFEYFNSKGMLEEIDIQQEQTLNKGTLIFLLECEDKVINYGIVLDDGSVGIVLDDDRKLQTHTLKDALTGNYTKVMVTK